MTDDSSNEPAAPRPARSLPKAYVALQSFLRRLVGLFFREVEVTGLEHIPTDRGGVVVSWHPNGLIDPGLILTQFPAQVVFGARHGLFKWPLLGRMLRELGTVPIFRASDSSRSDPDARRAANKKSLDALATKVAAGSFSALFPEGLSHDEPYLKELKTGVARLYYRARELSEDGAPPPVILPVGLHYDRKRTFRSRALIWFHAPIELPTDLDSLLPADASADAHKSRIRQLTDEIEHVLRDVVHATEDWRIHFLLHRARKLVRAERASIAGANPGKPGISEKALAFARIRTGYYQRLETHPDEIGALRDRIETYNDDLRGLRIDDHDLDRSPRLVSPWLAALLLLQFVLVFLLLPPVLVFGYLANAPTAVALWVLCRIAAKKKKDEATIKILVGAVAFPLTWAVAAIIGAFGHEYVHQTYPAIPDAPLLAGMAVALLAAIGGAAALRYLHVSQETVRAIRVRLTRHRRKTTLARLRVERTDLYNEVMRLADGLTLPGSVGEDGTIKPD